ncbi:hypothetical protein [uncultured Sphingomonas sp.]|nr:hypothetical protein [uncultured Sphingomonas sp.]
MKRKINIPVRPFAQADGEKRPRERRKLGLRYELVSGETVSGLR